MVAVSLLPGHLSSHAVQDPSISLDMDTAGNSYSDPGAAGDNSMTVGTIDNCLTTAAPGNDLQHNHSVHLIIQNVEDLVAWQARFNYDGGQMRPSAFNPTPFTDTNTTAQVGFLNLPIDPTLGDHRGVTPSQAIPPAAPGPQTALIGLNRFGANTAPISPDTPYINDEPTQSYDAPTGGILAAVTLQVLAGNAGNASLFMNMDDGNPNPPETNVTVFTSTGSQTLPIPVGQLGDSYHGEGATCVPLDCATPECPLVLTTPTETPTPTATPAPPTPTPATTPTVTPPPSPGPGGTFNPELSATYSETTPGSHPDITSTFTIGLGPDGQPGTDDDTGDYHFAGIVNFSPSSPQDSDIPDGAIIGTRQSMETIGVVNNQCVVLIPLEFTYMEATTDINDTVEPFPYGFSNDLGPIAGDAPPFDGVADVKPPPAVTKYPSYLNAIFDPDWVDYGADRIAGNADDTNGPQPPLKPRFRSVGIKSLPFAVGHWLIRQEVVFEPGTKLPNLPAFDPSLGYPTVIVHQMASAAGSATPPAIGLITDFCTPLETDSISFGITRDNPDTPADESGIPLRTLSGSGDLLTSISLAFSQRDADGDGYENTIDTCPFHTDTVWNPHSPRLPGSGIPGDRDIFVGVPFGDGISDICDPTPTELTHAPGGQPTDHDGDGFPNSGDNCPTTYNPDQTDNDLTVAGERAGDGIGDACDTPGTDGGMDCVSEGCAGSTPRPIPARSVSGQGPDVPDGEQIICARTLVVTIGGDPSAAVSDCLAGLPGAGTPFNPQSTVTFASTAPGASSDITLSFGLEAPDLLFTDVVSFSPTQLAVASGAEVADGAEVGTLGSQATLGLLNSSCTLPTNVDFTLFDATTNTRNAISASFDFLAGDINSDGVADIRPPPVVTQYPSFLNTLFGGVTPRARYAAATRIPSASFWVILQIAVFDPGTVLPGIAFDPTLGYPSVTVLLDPTSPPGPSAITDFCSPLTTSATIFGLTRDNVDTPLNEGGITLRTNPPAAGPVDFTVFAASRRDADGDGIENTLDPCPLHADAMWDPRAIAPPGGGVPGDSDFFAGRPAADGIPDTCDTTPNAPTFPPGGQPTDHDGDGFPNRGDNCPLVYNPGQEDDDPVAGVPSPDGIGNACDSPGTDAGVDFAGRPIPPRSVAGQGPTVPDGPRLLCTRTLTVQIGGPNDGQAGGCQPTLPGGEPPPCAEPPNDNADGATVVLGLPFSDRTDTSCATTAPDDPNCFGRGHTVWYSFTPDQDTRVEGNTFGSSYDTTLSVRTGSPGATTIACDDQAGGTNQSRVRFDAVAGETYFFMVSSFFGGPGGDLVFSVVVAPPALEVELAITDQGTIVAREGRAKVNGIVICSKPAFVSVSGHLSQRVGRSTINGSFFTSFSCEGETPWQASVAGENGRFVGGAANLSVRAFGFSEEEQEFDVADAFAVVRLRGSRPPPQAQ